MVNVHEIMHLTGGLRAQLINDAWELFPLRHNDKLQAIRLPIDKFSHYIESFGYKIIGTDQVNESVTNLPVRIWTPLSNSKNMEVNSADLWQAISIRARMSDDFEIANIARNISFSIRASGIRSRDASDHYHKQLSAALEKGRVAGKRFKNIPMIDLHLSFHSVLAEMAGARDYIAQFAARLVNAPSNIDAMSRLTEWVSKPTRTAEKGHELIELLLECVNNSGSDPWLADIANFRNGFLHKEPMGAGEPSNWLTLVGRGNEIGVILTIRMAIHVRPGDPNLCDALDRFSYLFEKLNNLAAYATRYSKYPATSIQIDL